MEKTNKVMRIVLSIVTFVAIAITIIGVLALPLQSVVADGKVVASANIYDYIKGFIDQCKMLPAMGEAAIQQIPALIMILLAIVFTLVFGIIAIVKGIILLVKSIKGMSGKGELNALLKSLTGFGAVVVIYIGLLLGVIFTTSEAQSVTLGSGSEMMLSGGLMALVVAGVYRVATKDDRKLINKILGFASVTLAVVGVIVGLAATLTLSGNTTGIFTVVFAFLSAMTSGVAPEGKVIFGLVLAVLGMVIVLVSLGFAKSLMKNGFLVDEEGKKVDFEKSNIVKSALWFGFMVLGFLLIVIPLSNNGFGMGAGAIVGMVMGALALAAAIVNKVLANKSKTPAKVEEEPAEAKAE